MVRKKYNFEIYFFITDFLVDELKYEKFEEQ